MSNTARLKLEQLIVYPVKSLRGIAVDHWPISEQGLAFDRHWMLVMPNGRFVTQRQLPEMALIDTAIEDSQLILSRSGHGSVSLPLQAPDNQGASFTAQVWRDECDVQEASEAASQWLNKALQPPQPLRLVRMNSNAQRPQSQPERFGADTTTQFADAAPFLIANLSSLDALNQHLQSKDYISDEHPARDMRRFRPNLVVSGLDAFEEHSHDSLQLNGFEFRLIDHCERCIITTINPDTADKDPEMETYRELAKINPMPEKPKAPAFGVNATLLPQADQPTEISVTQ